MDKPYTMLSACGRDWRRLVRKSRASTEKRIQFVNLTKRVKTRDGHRFCPVMLTATGRVIGDWVLVKGQSEHHPEGRFYLDYKIQGVRKREAAGRDPVQANILRVQRQHMLNGNAPKTRMETILHMGAGPFRPNADIDKAISGYLAETSMLLNKSSQYAYSNALADFRQSCTKQIIRDIKRQDLLDFLEFLNGKYPELAMRTRENKYMNVIVFLKACGVRLGPEATPPRKVTVTLTRQAIHGDDD